MKSLQKKFGLTLLLALLIALLISPAALAAEDWGLPEGSPEPIVYTDADKAFSYALLNPENVDVPNDKAVIITVLGDGFTNIIYPTGASMMTYIAMVKIPYAKWVKFVFPIVAIWFVIGLVAVYIAASIGY